MSRQTKATVLLAMLTLAGAMGLKTMITANADNAMIIASGGAPPPKPWKSGGAPPPKPWKSGGAPPPKPWKSGGAPPPKPW